MSEARKRGGFEDDPEPKAGGYCNHPEHVPPTHLYVPAGKRYRHICPACGQETVIRPTSLTW